MGCVHRRPGDIFDSVIRVGTFHDDEPDIYVFRDREPANDADLDFIAAARQDIPRLIAEIKRLRHELDHTTQHKPNPQLLTISRLDQQLIAH